MEEFGFKTTNFKSISRKLSARPIDERELLGPEEYLSSPIIISPRKAVPVVIITALAPYLVPVEVLIPMTFSFLHQE